jgi:drug/metabolite transporter (DMT)-like permease
MNRTYLGIGLAVLSMFFFSVTYAIFKACSSYIFNTQIIFIQSICSWILIAPFVLRGGVAKLKTERFWLIAARTIFGLLGMICITQALVTTNLAEVVLLNNTAPLFVPLIIWIWHKTKISHFLGISILIGFVGVFIILRPGFEEVRMGMLLAVLSGVFSALLLVVTRQIAGEPFMRTLFYYYLLWFVLLSPFVAFIWMAMTPLLWILLICSAFTSIAAQLSFTAAMRFVPSQEVAPLVYTSVIFSAIIGWLIWNEKMDLISLVGMLVVCAGGILTLVAARKRA